MKIFSEMLDTHDARNQPVQVFVLYLDSMKTGDPEKDIKNCGHSMQGIDLNDSESLINIVVPMISSLIEDAYGDNSAKTPLTDWHATGFDRNYPNGVKA